MSAKYERAVMLKISIVTKEWVEAIWDANVTEYVKADSAMFDKYKCPVFMQLIVTSSSLPKKEKEEVKRLINENGGTFMGPLDGTKVKIVLAQEKSPLTPKLKYALDNNIACLNPDWVYESVKVGYALPFNNFIIKSTKACSTPEKTIQSNETLNFSSISAIPNDMHKNNYINESLSSVMTSFSTTESMHSLQIPILDTLTLANAKMAGPFLDGCNIYLAGFAPNQRDKLNRILNVGSATRLDDISDALTHVLVGDENKASHELKVMKSKGLSPYVLTLGWLEESMKLKRPASEERFLYEQKSNNVQKCAEAPSPLSKKNLQMLQRPRGRIPSFNIDKKIPEKEGGSNLVQQYLQDTLDKTSGESSHQNESTPSAENKNQVNVDRRSTVQNNDSSHMSNKRASAGNESTVPVSQDVEACQEIFEGLTFFVTGFDDDDNYMSETITALGGEIVSHTYAGIPDYGIVPHCGAQLKHTVNEIVTSLFIEDCINQKQIVPIQYFHRPLFVGKNVKPLSDCIITISTYSGAERNYLISLVQELGAIHQDIFARKTNLERNVYGSTHLICPSPHGNKYIAAVKWKLPAVTAEWLKACVTQLKLVNETPFLVGETTAPERPETLVATQDSTDKNEAASSNVQHATRQFITPKRFLPEKQTQESGSSDRPLINKRLSLVMNSTPQSPFHVSTPDSPYGQVFKPDPSPNTRKGWAKWVDNFPDLRVEEPPLKRRALSTPLSELKRQLWQKIKTGVNKDEESSENTSFTEQAAPQTSQETVNTVEVDTTTPTTPINRKLEYPDENSPLLNNQISVQLAQLEKALQKSSSTPETRFSLSDESARNYKAEHIDDIQKCMTKDTQPDTVVWEDPIDGVLLRPEIIHEESANGGSDSDEEDANRDTGQKQEQIIRVPTPSPKRKFMLSGMKNRTMHDQVILKLGGEISMDPNFDATATHLLCTRPSRNEKMLGSIASGKWVLHWYYLRDSEQKGMFLDEEKYEWGNPKSVGVIPEPSGNIEEAIAVAAHRWRLKIMKEPRGAFRDMVTLLLVSGDKYDQFKRFIEAGEGIVVQAKPPYDTSSSGRKITHCFVNVKQMNQQIDWAMLASKGILCFPPQYLSDYLIAETPFDPRDCVIPEFKKYLTLLPK